jgi:C4-dicarboxylate transporter/malic acid transport protein
VSTAGSHRHPAWYGAVMGTGAVSLALAAQVPMWHWSWLTWAAVGFLVLASVLAVVLLPRYLGRVGDGPALRAEVADPAHGAMLATLPAGLLVLAAAWGRVGPSIVPTGLALWVSGVLLVLGTGIALTAGVGWSAAMLQTTPGLQGVNGGWLIPPVMNLLVPVALTPLIVANPGAAPILVLVGFAFYGIGLVLFLAVFTLLVARLAFRGPLPAAMIPSLWIPLAPAGILGVALIRLLEGAHAAGVPGFEGSTAGLAVAAMGIGLGLWWAGFAAVELQRVRRAGRPPVHPGWWGFVFPVGAMTLSWSAVATAADSTALAAVGLAATAGLIVLWGFVATQTAGQLRRRPEPAPTDATVAP